MPNGCNTNLFEKKVDCCACGACVNKCPVNAIAMEEDIDGFVYPNIDYTRCISCGACKRACAYQNQIVKNSPITSYVAVNKERKQKMESASGGIFAAMATKIISSGGVVFGATLEKRDNLFISHHIAVDALDNIKLLQGSKYVQSDTEFTFKEVLSCLQDGKKVLYSGTPCQVAGLKQFLEKDYENLITVDLICHGVPSNRFFNEYLSFLKKRLRAKDIIGYSFRDKKKGWGMNCRVDFLTQNGKEKTKYIPARLESYNTLFLDGLTYRENCYTCKYACRHRPGDFTIGDYWGIDKEHPDIFDNRLFVEQDGISCLIVNSEKGKKIIDDCFFDNLEIYMSHFDKVAKKNGQLNSPSKLSESRSIIFDVYREKAYAGVEDLFRRIYKKQRILHWVFNKMPMKLRKISKNVLHK